MLIRKDNETYKSFVRKQIADWINIVSTRKHQEWMVVYVSSEKSKGTATRFLTSSVFDKVKTDFNLKKERCLQIKLASEDKKDAELWLEFLDRMKESIINSYNYQIITYEEEARRIELQRAMPNWNYCQYFLMKVFFD